MNLMEKYRARLNEVLKEEIFCDSYLLIEKTLQDINRVWEPRALEWIKLNRPNDWDNILTLERGINRMALESNLRGLRDVLGQYQEIILAMVREYKALKENKGQEMFNFEERPKSPRDGLEVEKVKAEMG